jgi:pimeloyl-ACP methyl ester carboxylesterase
MLRKFLVAIGLIFSGLLLALVYSINMMINRPVLIAAGTLADKGYREFTAVTSDGIKIYACFYEGATGADTIVLCHGHGVDSRMMNDMVRFLRNAGYGILLFDFRAHGRSDGRITSIGLHEWQDIKAAIAAAKKLGFIADGSKLAAYGRSMGAAALINGAAKLPEIDAFVLESSFERLRNIAARDAGRRLKLPDSIFTDIVFWITGKVTGIDYLANNPAERIRDLVERPVFLIHDENDYRADVQAFNMLKEQLPEAETWIAPDAWHVCAHQRQPVAFENRFLDFLFRSGIRGII